MLALATEDETLPWPKTRVGVFDEDGTPDFQGSADSSWVYAEENGGGFSRNAPDHIVQLEPVAEVDGAGNVVSRFVYATKGHSPDYVIKDGSTYRIVSDHLGSPRMVIDVDTGAVIQRMDFDEWGVVTLDTNPGWQPFGFAGGLLDADTGLTRFGARDYAAAEGRWTAKDPLKFDAGDSNLFGYVMGDPINNVDPSGLRTPGTGNRTPGEEEQQESVCSENPTPRCMVREAVTDITETGYSLFGQAQVTIAATGAAASGLLYGGLIACELAPAAAPVAAVALGTCTVTCRGSPPLVLPAVTAPVCVAAAVAMTQAQGGLWVEGPELVDLATGQSVPTGGSFRPCVPVWVPY